MKVWWCARYQRIEDNEGYCHSNRYPTRGNVHSEADEGCGLMRLVPVDALVIAGRRGLNTLPSADMDDPGPLGTMTMGWRWRRKKPS